MSKSTNILKAIVHLVKVEEATFTLNQNYQNKIQGQGEKLESYIKRLFSLRLNDEDLDPKLFKLKGKIDEKTISMYVSNFYGLLAQMVERMTLNH